MSNKPWYLHHPEDIPKDASITTPDIPFKTIDADDWKKVEDHRQSVKNYLLSIGGRPALTDPDKILFDWFLRIWYTKSILARDMFMGFYLPNIMDENGYFSLPHYQSLLDSMINTLGFTRSIRYRFDNFIDLGRETIHEIIAEDPQTFEDNTCNSSNINTMFEGGVFSISRGFRLLAYDRMGLKYEQLTERRMIYGQTLYLLELAHSDVVNLEKESVDSVVDRLMEVGQRAVI